MYPASRTAILIAAALVLVGAAILFFPRTRQAPAPITATSTPQATTTAGSISDGTITVTYSSEEFGLAVRPEQVLVRSYIPPCDENFDYCFYYIGPDYQGTNFESAGLRIKKRTDLTGQSTCLRTLPEGYSGIAAAVSTSTAFSTSRIGPLGDAAAGHYARGTLYRLSYKDSCHEFETRVGASQYANYPRGTIKEFMPPDQRAMEAKLLQLVNNVTLPGDVRPFARAR